jgi:hypothetical protein
MTSRGGRLTGSFFQRSANEPHWVDRGPCGFQGAVATILEVGLPLAALGVSAGSRLAFFLALSTAGAEEIERHPEHGPVELTVPDERFEARNWTA